VLSSSRASACAFIAMVWAAAIWCTSIDERPHGLGADRHLATVAERDGPGAMEHRDQGEMGLMFELRGLAAVEGGANDVTCCLGSVGAMAELLSAELHLERSCRGGVPVDRLLHFR
jgi:hypothetical protein